MKLYKALYKTIGTLSLILLCSSCSRNLEYRTLSLYNSYTISVPSIINTQGGDANNETIQLEAKAIKLVMRIHREALDSVKQLYLEPGNSYNGHLLDTIGDRLLTGYMEFFSTIETVEQIDTTIATLPSHIYYLTGNVQNNKIRYINAFIEDNAHLYQITAIMPYKKGETQQQIIDDMIYSFTHINP